MNMAGHIPVDKLRFYRNTVRLPYDGEGSRGYSARFGFFTCESCDVPEGKHGYLLDAQITHYCDDCGGPLIMWIRR